MLNTIVAEAIDELADKLEDALEGGAEPGGGAAADPQSSPTPPTSRSCFGGDNYSEEWHAEAERRGLLNLRATPDALP